MIQLEQQRETLHIPGMAIAVVKDDKVILIPALEISFLDAISYGKTFPDVRTIIDSVPNRSQQLEGKIRILKHNLYWFLPFFVLPEIEIYAYGV